MIDLKKNNFVFDLDFDSNSDTDINLPPKSRENTLFLDFVLLFPTTYIRKKDRLSKSVGRSPERYRDQTL